MCVTTMQIAFDRTAVFVCGTCVRWHFGGWTGQCWRAPLSVSWALVFGYSALDVCLCSVHASIRCAPCCHMAFVMYQCMAMLLLLLLFFFDVLRRQTNFLSVLCACDVFYFLYLLILGTVQYGLFWMMLRKRTNRIRCGFKDALTFWNFGISVIFF